MINNKQLITRAPENVAFYRHFGHLVGESNAFKKVLADIVLVAPHDTKVLITGETGTGKELVAKTIHENSARKHHNMISVNCAALPADLIESEFFGHEKGAFTGAITQKTGKFELAHKGTLFLDEIGELSVNLQAKLLRVIQDGVFERVGGTKPIRTDVRIIAATNRDLLKMTQEGAFREDLYYRLKIFPIHNPPLRERRRDIPLLAKYFLARTSESCGKKITTIASTSLQLLENYSFPGNIRELANIIERAVVSTRDDILHIPKSYLQSDWLQNSETVFDSFEEMQRSYIIKALRRTNGKVTGPGGAAELLKLNDNTLSSKIRKFKIRNEELLG